MLTIYRALIRSVLDYGCIAFDSMSETSKRKLDAIQHRALRIACGAFCSTSAAALQVETGEMPLELRRNQQQLNYALKIEVTQNHPAKSILVRERLAITHKYNENNKPFYCKVKDFFDNVDIRLEAPRLSTTPPWHLKAPKIDKSLTLEVSKKDAPEILKSIAMERIENYKDAINIYTDASKTIDGKTAAAFYVPAFKIEHAERLTDNITIFAAELTAIKLALQWISTKSVECRPNKTVAIFSDSLSSIQAIETGRTTCRPGLLSEVLELITHIPTDIVIMWVPSHIGIQGNEAVDKLANSGISKVTAGTEVKMELGEAMQLAEKYVKRKWQNLWTNGTTGRHYSKIEPLVNGDVKYVSSYRVKEVKITRLRLGKCNLNAYLHEIGLHPNGLCEKCKTPETIEHHLLQCENAVSNAVQQACRQLKIKPTLSEILSDIRMIDIVYNSLERKI